MARHGKHIGLIIAKLIRLVMAQKKKHRLVMVIFWSRCAGASSSETSRKLQKINVPISKFGRTISQILKVYFEVFFESSGKFAKCFAKPRQNDLSKVCGLFRNEFETFWTVLICFG